MKLVLILISLLSMQFTFAQETTVIESGDLAITRASARIHTIMPICPVGPNGVSCRAFGSTVTVMVTLRGCMDRFGGHFSKFEMVEGKAILFFNSLNIATEASQVTRCVRMPTRTIKLFIPYEGEVELRELVFIGSTKN